MRRLAQVCIFFLVSGTAHVFAASTTTGNLSVTATVSSTCSVTTTTVAFGTYNPTSGSPTQTSGAVNVTCTTGSTYSIALDAGANPSSAGNVTTRRMKANTSDYLPYQIYSDSGRTTIWGDGANGSSVNPTTGNFTGNGSAQAATAYGQITAGRFVAPGSYLDTVVATVTYN